MARDSESFMIVSMLGGSAEGCGHHHAALNWCNCCHRL